MLDTTASAKKKSKKIKETSFQDEVPSLGPSKPLEKKTYQNFAELYESSGESDLNSSKPDKVMQKSEREKSYRSLVFHNKSRGGKENENAKTPKNKKNRSISESNVTNDTGTPAANKKWKHSSISEESVNINTSQDNSFLGKKKRNNKLLDLTYNPQITSTPTTDTLQKSKLLNNTKDKSVTLNDNVQNASIPGSSKKSKKNKPGEGTPVIEAGTPGKGNNKRNRKKSKSIENDVTPKKIKTDQNKSNVIEGTNGTTENLNKDKEAPVDEKANSKNTEKKRKVLKSETENQEQIGDANNEAEVSEPKKKKKNRNKNKNAEEKAGETEQGAEGENLSEDDDIFANARPVNKKNKVKATPKEGQEKPNKKGKKTKRNNQEVKQVTEDMEEKTEKSIKKWNKHNKFMTQGVHITNTTLLIENLPLNLMLKYKPILREHFVKYGPIRNVGVIELYPMEDPRPVFSTTVRYHSEDSAEKALQEDNTVLEGKRIRVRPMLPTEQTTIVVKGKGLSEQALSTIFAPCGRLRSIRIVVKGRRSKYQTGFIEFDGPEAVAKGLKVAQDATVGGKAVTVSHYELRSLPEHPAKAELGGAVQAQGKTSDDESDDDED